MFCTSCGAHLGGREHFCPYCGAKTMFDSEDTAPLNGNEGEVTTAAPHAETAQDMPPAPLGEDAQNAEIDRGGADAQNAAFVPQNAGTSPENGNGTLSGENVAPLNGSETSQGQGGNHSQEQQGDAFANPYAQNNNSYVQNGNPAFNGQNPQGGYNGGQNAYTGNPYAQNGNPYAPSGNNPNAQNGYTGNPYMQQGNAFGVNPHAQNQNNPYAQSNHPYAQSGNNFSFTPFGMPYFVQRPFSGNAANRQELPVNPYGKQNPYLPKPGYSLLTDDFYGKNKLSAGAYGILFGMFGGNCFYLGNVWGGILSLLSFLLGVILAAAGAADVFGIIFILLPEVVNAVFGFLYLFQDDRKFVRHISPKIRYRDTVSRIL